MLVADTFLSMAQSCRDSGYTDVLPRPDDVIIELSSPTHPGTFISDKRLQFISDEIYLRPGLYSYASKGLERGSLGRGAVQVHNMTWHCLFDEKFVFLNLVDTGFFSVSRACSIQIEIRYAEGHDWSLQITRED